MNKKFLFFTSAIIGLFLLVAPFSFLKAATADELPTYTIHFDQNGGNLMMYEGIEVKDPISLTFKVIEEDGKHVFYPVGGLDWNNTDENDVPAYDPDYYANTELGYDNVSPYTVSSYMTAYKDVNPEYVNTLRKYNIEIKDQYQTDYFVTDPDISEEDYNNIDFLSNWEDMEWVYEAMDENHEVTLYPIFEDNFYDEHGYRVEDGGVLVITDNKGVDNWNAQKDTYDGPTIWTIVFMPNVTRIPAYAFQNQNDIALIEVIFLGKTPPTIGNEVFEIDEEDPIDFYVPEGCIDVYKKMLKPYKGNLYDRYADEKESKESTETKKPAAIKVKKITIKGASRKIAAGKKIKLTASISPKNASNKAITWKSQNSKYATVNSKGLVTTKPAGKGKRVAIIARSRDGGASAKYYINIRKGIVKKIRITGKKKVKAGKTIKLKAKVTASKGAYKKVEWKSGNKKIATVSSKGLVRIKKGTKGKKVKITAKALDGSGKKGQITLRITK